MIIFSKLKERVCVFAMFLSGTLIIHLLQFIYQKLEISFLFHYNIVYYCYCKFKILSRGVPCGQKVEGSGNVPLIRSQYS